MTTSTQADRDRAELAALISAAVAELTAQWARLTRAQDRLLRALERLHPGLGATTRIRRHIVAFNEEVGEFNRLARAIAERWAGQDLPVAYRDGALRALDRVTAGGVLFRWTQDHQAAVTVLTATFYADLMRRIAEAVRRAQVFSRSAQQAARDVTLGRNREGVNTRQLLAQHPMGTVIYANQSRHPVAAWAASALLWQGVVAANRGAINAGRWELDALWFECVDGPECGFTSHQDTDHANGTIRSADDAGAYPTAHHGCVRQWIPRPDLNHRLDITSGDPA
ncbi:hypothetical protein [Streptomyces sp. NPDC101249]|uniref:hypothetical protein n=1 Tax=Streptomyces sp. NPDC101249 TaxID=3366140 RepID=UPI0037F24300